MTTDPPASTGAAERLTAARAAVSAPVPRTSELARAAPVLLAEVDRLTAERDRLLDAIRDIDAHATPFGLADPEDPDGNPHHYVLTVGALHRALGAAEGRATAAKCEAEVVLDEQARYYTSRLNQAAVSYAADTRRLMGERDEARATLERVRGCLLMGGQDGASRARFALAALAALSAPARGDPGAAGRDRGAPEATRLGCRTRHPGGRHGLIMRRYVTVTVRHSDDPPEVDSTREVEPGQALVVDYRDPAAVWVARLDEGSDEWQPVGNYGVRAGSDAAGGKSAEVTAWLAGAPERDCAPAGPDDPEED